MNSKCAMLHAKGMFMKVLGSGHGIVRLPNDLLRSNFLPLPRSRKPSEPLVTARSRGWTPLFVAAHCGCLEPMKLLLTAKASVHVCGNDGGEPSLEARFLRMGRGFKARQLNR